MAMSASLPGSMLPFRSPSDSACAPFIVAEEIASAGDIFMCVHASERMNCMLGGGLHPGLLRCGKDLFGLLHAECVFFAEYVHELCQLLLRGFRHHALAHQADILVALVLVFHGQDMRAQKSRHHSSRPLLRCPP